MKKRVKNLCLKWLLWALDDNKDELIIEMIKMIDVPGSDPNTKPKTADQWMALSWQHIGFREYVSGRDLSFLKFLGGGAALVEKGQKDYTRGIGQRFELLSLMSKCKKAFNEEQRKKQEREKNIEKK